MFVKRRIPLWQRLFNIRHHSRTHTARLRRRISDELYGRAHSHRAADPADVLESSIIFSGKHSHPDIYRMSQKSFSDDGLSTIRTNVIKNPYNTAVLFGDLRLTWQDVWERSNRLGNALINLGLTRQDRVMIFLPNCMEYPEVILGINKAGLVATGCNFRLTGPEVAYQVNDSGARAIILQGTEQLETIQAIREQTPALENIIMLGKDAPKGVIAYQEALDSASAEDPPIELDSGEVHLLMYTSGTTGKPKAAARTYKADYHMANAVCHELGLRSDDTYLAVAPIMPQRAWDTLWRLC